MKKFFTFLLLLAGLGNARNLSGFKNLTGLIPKSTTMKNSFTFLGQSESKKTPFVHSWLFSNQLKKVFTFLLVLAGLGLGANNLQIKNVALVDNDTVAKTVMIRFDISWEHSWRDEINWDAAWVFAKYFDGEKPYKHCKLSLGGEMPGNGTPHTLIVPNDSLELDGTYYGVGAFIYRSELSDGTFDADSVMLKWNYGLNGFETLPEDIELHVYGTEMVYIPEGPFAFGDGDGENMSYASWHLKDSPDYVYIGDYLAPLMINPNEDADDQARFHGIRVHGKHGLDWDGDGTIDNPRFPTGYKAFYIMKYMITQGKYSDYLNSLTQYQIDLTNSFPYTIEHRFNITIEDGKYVCNRPDRACNYLHNRNRISLADWIALRPMSAMEYEKAARGPLNPIVDETAWGDNSTAINLTGLSGEENGTELPLPENANFNSAGQSITGGDGGSGPVRVGIFARENTDRTASGASFYGVMEQSANLWELAIEMLKFGGYGYRGYIDAHGDGELELDGRANSIKALSSYGTIFSITEYNGSRRYIVSNYSNNNYIGYDYNCGARYVRNAPQLP